MHEDLPGSSNDFDFTRRGFVVTTLAAGFALATQPVAAETITTDTQGLEAGEVKIPVADGTLPAYRAEPGGGKNLPVILVIQEIFGVHEHIKDVCRRLAKLGYLAIAPELYARQGDVSKMTDFKEIIGTVVSKVPDAQVMSDLDATVAWAKTAGQAMPQTGDHRLLLGWADRLALRRPQPAAQGRSGLVRPTGRRHRSVASQIPGRPGRFAGRPDPGPVRRGRQGHSAGERREDAGRGQGGGKDGRDCRLSRYAPCFFADYRESYRAEAAADGWKRMLEWFRKNGVA